MIISFKDILLFKNDTKAFNTYQIYFIIFFHVSLSLFYFYQPNIHI